MEQFLCKIAIKILQKYKKSVVLNYQIRGDIRPIYNNPILKDFHIIGRSFIDDSSMEFEDHRNKTIDITHGLCDGCLRDGVEDVKSRKYILHYNQKVIGFCDEHLIELHKSFDNFIKQEGIAK